MRTQNEKKETTDKKTKEGSKRYSDLRSQIPREPF